MVRRSFIIIPILIVTFYWYSCKNNHINVVDSSFRHKLGIDISESTCIYAFNGNCSSCISDLIDYQKQWNAKFPCSNVIYLSNSSNKEIIEYYIDKFELSINNDNVLSREHIDSINLIFKRVDFEPVIILCDKDENSAILGNPFHDNDIMEIYESKINCP